MTHQELEEYLEGYNLRTALLDNSLRRLWLVLYNANFTKKIRTVEQLHAQWPNYLDKLSGEISDKDEEIILETEEQLRDFYIKLKANFDGN